MLIPVCLFSIAEADDGYPDQWQHLNAREVGVRIWRILVRRLFVKRSRCNSVYLSIIIGALTAVKRRVYESVMILMPLRVYSEVSSALVSDSSILIKNVVY